MANRLLVVLFGVVGVVGGVGVGALYRVHAGKGLRLYY